MGIFEHRLLTTKEVAEILRVHPTTVIRFIKDRRIPGIRVGCDYRVSSAGLEQIMGAPAIVRKKKGT